MASTSTVPLLLPRTGIVPPPELAAQEWKPRAHKRQPQPPPPDETKLQELQMALARQAVDGKAVKKIRPRRTVDYGAALGRWALLRKMRSNTSYVPAMRPCPPYIIDLLPPKAYPDNASTSLCTKFIHTSTNKIRCPVNVVTWTPEGRRVLTGSTSGEFTLWNGLTFNFETILQAHDSAIRALVYSHSGAFIASADQSGTIKYFQPNMNNVHAWQGHREAVRALTWSPDDARFATASDDASVRIWDFEQSREERSLTGHGWDVKCVEWHPTKGLLVSGSKDNSIKFWDPRSGTCLSTLHQHKNTIQALAWSPSGDLLASASRDATARIFDIRAMKEYLILRGHKKEVCSLAWHPVHPLLVSGGSEGSLLHWDISSTTPLPNLPSAAVPASSAAGAGPGPRAQLSQAHDSNVWSLSFHPLGHLLASASNDQTTRFWARERPGATATGLGGAERPPMILDDSQAEREGEDEDVLPGFGGEMYEQDGPRMGGGIPGFGGDEGGIPGFGPSGGNGDFAQGMPMHGQGSSMQQQQQLPFMTGTNGTMLGDRAAGRPSRWGPSRGRPY